MVNNIQKNTPVSVLFTLNFPASPLAKIHIAAASPTGFHVNFTTALFHSAHHSGQAFSDDFFSANNLINYS
jgi:hypothetical protein